MSTICRYCMAEVSEREIEAEDGCCPECGALIAAGVGYLGADDEIDDNLDELEEDDGFNFDDDEDDGEFGEFDDDAFLDDDFDGDFDDEGELDDGDEDGDDDDK